MEETTRGCRSVGRGHIVMLQERVPFLTGRCRYVPPLSAFRGSGRPGRVMSCWWGRTGHRRSRGQDQRLGSMRWSCGHPQRVSASLVGERPRKRLLMLFRPPIRAICLNIPHLEVFAQDDTNPPKSDSHVIAKLASEVDA